MEQLAYPNGMTRVNTYENSRDLLSVIDYRRPGSANPPARHEYDYDALGRPTRRRDTWNTAAPKTTRLFTYNSRGELIRRPSSGPEGASASGDTTTSATGRKPSGRQHDGLCETDELNRYAGIAGNGAAAFVPQYDADGNQTLVKTSTGIWTVTYNAENRPVKFESEDGGTTVECAYDSMGRRFEKKVTVGGTTGFHARYLYRDYLQVAECDLTGGNAEACAQLPLEKKKNKCRVFVKILKNLFLVILEYWPSEDEKIVGYSKKRSFWLLLVMKKEDCRCIKKSR